MHRGPGTLPHDVPSLGLGFPISEIDTVALTLEGCCEYLERSRTAVTDRRNTGWEPELSNGPTSPCHRVRRADRNLFQLCVAIDPPALENAKKCIQQKNTSHLALLTDWPCQCTKHFRATHFPCHQFSALGESFCLPGQDTDLIKAEPELWAGPPFSLLQLILTVTSEGVNLASGDTEPASFT